MVTISGRCAVEDLANALDRSEGFRSNNRGIYQRATSEGIAEGRIEDAGQHAAGDAIAEELGSDKRIASGDWKARWTVPVRGVVQIPVPP